MDIIEKAIKANTAKKLKYVKNHTSGELIFYVTETKMTPRERLQRSAIEQLMRKSNIPQERPKLTSMFDNEVSIDD